MQATAEPNMMRPHAGKQEQFLSSAADICIYGGAAGGGKTYALLMEPLRHIHIPDFTCVIFRRTSPQIRQPGGLKDVSYKIYPMFGGVLNETEMRWTFPSGATVTFSHLQHEKDKHTWQGAQVALICLDEGTHFSGPTSFYLMSRNRSTCGVRPYMRITCNPDPRSWLAKFIAWWIDPAGNPIPERSGVLRWFVRVGDDLVWGDTREELEKEYDLPAKSVSFVPAMLKDNPTLMREDPGYRANLLAQPRVERERLMRGNWRASESGVIDTKWFRTYESISDGYQVIVGGDVHTVPVAACRRFSMIDTAGTSRDRVDESRGKAASWSVCGIWDWYPSLDLLFLIHVWRAQVGWIDLKERVPAVMKQWRCRRGYVENAHSGAALKTEMRGLQIELIGPKIAGMAESGRGAKLDRAIASGVLARIEDGSLFLPAAAGWLADYLNEWAAWTGHPDDPSDQIDVSSYASHVMRRQATAWGGTINTGGMVAL